MEDRLASALAESAFAVVSVLNRLGAEHDLSLTQVRVLGILRDRQRVRVTRLAEHLGLEKSTLTGLVDRGVRRGLLTREPSPGDGRAVDVSLTPAGHALCDRVYAEFAHAMGALTAGLTNAERDRLTVLSQRLVEAAG